MSKVTLTIRLDLETPGLPSEAALSAAMYRAERAAARVFVNGDRGGEMTVTVAPSPNEVPKTCDAVNILAGNIHATVGKRKRAKA